MNKIFLSYRRVDQAFAGRIYDRLKERFGEDRIFKDVDNIPLGRDFRKVLANEVQACQVVVVAIGPDWLNLKDADGNRRLDTPRDFVRTEIELALERDIPVIPLLLENTAMPAESELPDSIKNLAYRQAARVRPDPDFDHDIGRLCAAIDSAGIPVPLTSKFSEVCPYRGLEVFQIDDAGVYFGREDVIDLAWEKISDFSSSDVTRFLAIIGASGSGKSSLAYAGILARLTQGSTSDWPIVICRPGHNPVEELAIALRAESRTATAAGDIGELIDKLSNDQRRLHLVSRLALEGRPAEERLVLFVDQFEELFRPGDINIRKAFIGNLLHAAKAPEGKTIVLITMRADFYAKASVYPNLANVLAKNQILVGPMSEDQIRAAIEKPAQLSGVRFESGLVDLMVQDMKTEAGALPFLQDALTQLWHRQTVGLITVADYKEIGRLEGAIENRANEFYASLSDKEQEECRRLLLRLTQPGEGTEDTKRRVRRTDLAGTSEMENIIQKLTKARLITTESEGQSDRETAYVEVSHEALIRGWSQLRKWIDADRDALRIQHQITADAAIWQSNQDDAFLYRGARLGIAEDWLQTHADSLTETELEFVNASRALREHEELQRANAAKRLKRLALLTGAAAVAATILAIVTSFLAVGFNRARKDEQQQKRIVVAQRLSTEAQELADEDLGKAVTLAADAIRTVLANRVVVEKDIRHPLNVLDAVLSDRDRKDKLLALARRPTLLKPVLSPSGRWLVTQSYDHSIYLWNLTSVNPSRQRLSSPEGTVSSVTFSEDDNWLIQVGAGGKLRLHDLRKNCSVDLPSEKSSIRICRFDVNGLWLMTADPEAIRLWNLSANDLLVSPSPTKVLRDIEPYSRQFGGFSPDGKWFVMSDSQGVHLWLLAELTSESKVERKIYNAYAGFRLPGSEEYRLTAYRNELTYTMVLSPDYGLTFSPDGRWLPIIDLEQKQTRLVNLNSDDLDEVEVKVTSENGSTQVGLTGQYASFDATGRKLAVSDGKDSIHVFTIIAPSTTSIESSAVSVKQTAKLDFGATKFRFVNEDWLLTTRRFYSDVTEAYFLKDMSRLPIKFQTSVPLISSADGRWIIGTSLDGVRSAYDLTQEIPEKAPFNVLQNFFSDNLCFTPNNHWLALAETESLFLWDLTEQPPFSNSLQVATEFNSSDAVQGILATRSGSQIIIVGDWYVRIFQRDEKNEWEHIRSLEGTRSDTESHSVDKIKNFLVYRGECVTELANLGDDLSTQRIRTLCNDKATHVEVSPNGDWVVAATERGTVYATNLDEFQPTCIAEDLGKVTAMASSADGAFLFVASSGGRIHLWETSGFKKQILIDDHDTEVFAFASDPDSKWLVSRSYDGSGFLRRLEAPHKIVAELKDGQWIRDFDSSISNSDYVQADDWTINMWNSLLRSVKQSKKYTIDEQVKITKLIGYGIDQVGSTDAEDLPLILRPSNNTGVLDVGPLLPGMVIRAGYSPSGNRLVFSNPEGLFTSSADGSDRQQLLQFGKDPVWEPKKDSTQIAFVAGRYFAGEEIWVIEPNAEKPKYLANGGWPTWSNDGRLFYHNRQESTLHCIDMRQSPPTDEELMPMQDSYPSVSHDGNYVSHMSPRDNVWLEPASILCVTDLNSGDTVHKFPFYGIDGILSSWSPNGKFVAVGTFARRKDATGIWIVNVKEKKAVQLAKGAFRRPMWDPDGKSLIFDSEAGLWSLPFKQPSESEWLDPNQVLKMMFDDYTTYLKEDEPGAVRQPAARAYSKFISKDVSILLSFAFGLLDSEFLDESLKALKLAEQEVSKNSNERPDVEARYYALLATVLENKAQAIDQFLTSDECKKKASSALQRARNRGLITSEMAEEDPYLKSIRSGEE